MKDLKNSIYVADLTEGLLDDMEDTLTAGDDHMNDEMFKNWSLSDSNKIKKTKKGYKLKGDFKIKDIDKYEGPKILNVDGNFSISNTKLETLEGLFDVECEIEGTFTIENNSKLTSLNGCPLQVNTLVLNNNKALTDLSVAPVVMINAYISRNGKKFKKDELAKQLQVYKHIFCSIDDDSNIIEESLLLEAFKAPQLKLVAKAIKNASKDIPRNMQMDFKDIYNIEWDKIEASQIAEYDVDDAKCLTLARKYIAGGGINGISGMMALIDKDGEVTGIIKYKRFCRLKDRGNYWWHNKLDKYSNFTDLNTTDLIDIIRKHDTVLFIRFDSDNYDMDGAWKKHKSRVDARQGALAMQRGFERTGKSDPSTPWILSDEINIKQVRYYQDVADQNRERYKKLLTQIKAQRAAMSNTFAAIKSRMDAAFKRYTELLVKILANPAKYESWDVSWLNDKFSEVHNSKRYGVTHTGLFVKISQYISYMIDISKGNNYGNKDIQANIKHYENEILKSLDAVERKLTELEAK
jgi:hypothetical protein